MMEVKTIPEMNRHLDELNQFFSTRSQKFKTTISLHEGRFTQQDYRDFEGLLDEIKRNAMEKITSFFDERLSEHSTTYETEISGFVSDGDNVKSDLDNFRASLTQATLDMKEEQNRKEALMDHFSEKLRRNLIMKKCFNLLRKYELERKEARARDQRMDMLYRKNLLKKSFFPWRTLTYKDGYASTVQREAEKDIMNIHKEYQTIIDILKTKINETDEIIRVKKAAKGEFAYALSKNLLKTISNLSLEVMNLNQMSLRDGEWSQQSTQKFMTEIDTVIKEKLVRVRQYKRELTGDNYEDEPTGEKKKKHISFA